MNNKQFAHIFSEQVNLCEEVLVNKAKEYATEDRLHNFKIAASLQDISVQQAVSGMLAKHTVSIFDMCQAKDGEYSMEVWNEKITDHINYLILLKAVVHESCWGEED